MGESTKMFHSKSNMAMVMAKCNESEAKSVLLSDTYVLIAVSYGELYNKS